MSYQNDYLVFFQLVNDRVEVLPSVGIKPSERLVKEEDGSIGLEGPEKSEALPLPHTEFLPTIKHAAKNSGGIGN